MQFVSCMLIETILVQVALCMLIETAGAGFLAAVSRDYWCRLYHIC